MKNSKYTKEFKDSTIQLVINSNKSAYQIAQDLDINDKTLYSWILAIVKQEREIWFNEKYRIIESMSQWNDRRRLHSYNDYMSPVEFEEKMLHKEMVA